MLSETGQPARALEAYGQARSNYEALTRANPAVTSGLSPKTYGINFENTNPEAAGLPSFVIAGFFGGGTSALGDPQQPRAPGEEGRVGREIAPVEEVPGDGGELHRRSIRGLTETSVRQR